jgi:hypothetical protein
MLWRGFNPIVISINVNTLSLSCFKFILEHSALSLTL